jgi:hypothetical protein
MVAPAVLAERASEYFKIGRDVESPYMLVVAPVRDEKRLTNGDGALSGLDKLKALRSEVPAITHVDYSARIQTVDDRHGRFRKLLQRFDERTGCPMMVNTSFNLGWDPIVCSPKGVRNLHGVRDRHVLCMGRFPSGEAAAQTYSGVENTEDWLPADCCSPLCHRAAPGCSRIGPSASNAARFEREKGISEALLATEKFD